MYKITNREEVMSVGTNENVKQNLKKIKDAVSIGGQELQPEIDMQATQKIDFLDELKKDSYVTAEKNNKNKQGIVVPQEATAQDEIEDTQPKKIDNSLKKAQREEAEEENKVRPDRKNIETQIDKKDNIDDIENNNNNESAEELAKRKEKQHAQDKKDFRLERMLFARINVMQGKIKESLELIQKYERIDAKEGNLPNIVTTLHDKLTQEVIKQFRTVGIEFNMKSFLVQSIVSDLLNKFEEGITEFRNCSENLNFVREVQEDFESRVELAPTSKVKTIFARLRGIFKPERKQEKLEQLERERQEQKLEKANIHLIKYKFINSELAKYTIKNNIVRSLTKEILHGQGSGLTLNVSEFIESKVAPEMKMLGLESHISELEETIYNEYKQKQNISKDEFNGLPVGEIRKNMKAPRTDVAMNKVMKVVAVNKANVAECKDDEEEIIAM